ncbi:hypothetical protein [Sinomicrobium weinanense]|uniref:Uncharacterized protein n=1 Tax=Sinomicrobium weinanense TaxID=2842200 RepID=A0A926JUL7_9FLAO|nr:hypothetical protein [Sinomicrobium weinanense]MBC9797538.1 hypothetical protein [Sinomicrobium weinanense]MBU3122397.1 hypothetical protein [Sinomicrobium weinanense]
MELDKVPFENAYNVYKVLKEKYMEMGSTSDDYTFHLRIHNGSLRWYAPDVSNERVSYALILNPDGTLKSVVKH